MHGIIESARHPLFQLKEFLALISPEEYTLPLSILSNASIGMHSRHIIEFYQCLALQTADGRVDYDARQRDLRQENDRDFAMRCIDDVLETLTSMEDDKEIKLVTTGHDDHKINITTTLQRELTYVTEHGIHHMAILKMACFALLPHINFHPDFGVAYSTIKYRERVHSNLPS